jgi:putative spermidine/putrescine transport system permease protein
MTRGSQSGSQRRALAVSAAPSRLTRGLILGIIGAVFAIPIIAMIEFSLRDGLTGGYTLTHWTGLLDPEAASKFRSLTTGLTNSLLLAVVTVGIVLFLLLPTMILVQLRFPRLRRVLEFICIIPITVPAIVLVVGLAPVYRFVGSIFGSSIWTLAFAYGITVLPYAYRALQSNLGALDAVTLSEAARSLGASWPNVLWRVLLPNLRRGILAASFISVAVVLGEFTIASLLSRQNLQTAILLISKSDPYVAVIFALLALLMVFLLLLLIGKVGTRHPGARRRKQNRKHNLKQPVTPGPKLDLKLGVSS